jgi:hypothetical protein
MCTISLKQPERSVCIGTRQEKKMSYQHIVEHKKTSLHKYEFPIYASLSHTMTGYECFVSQFWILNQCRLEEITMIYDVYWTWKNGILNGIY